MLEVWTAQYRYNGPDRLDITVKGQDPLGKYFAPSWEMVMKCKQGKISEEEYTRKYLNLMQKSKQEHPEAWEKLLSRKRVVLVCFCPPGAFCHRVILAKLLEKYGAVYKGEIKWPYK